MKRIIHAYERKTFKYRDGWRSLDQEEYVGDLHVLSHFFIEDDDGEHGQHVLRIKLPRVPAMTDELIRNVMNNYLGSRCTHEYDCCGCWSAYVDDIRKPRERQHRGREVIVNMYAYRNL